MSVASIAPSGRKETAANLTGTFIVAFLRLGDEGQYGVRNIGQWASVVLAEEGKSHNIHMRRRSWHLGSCGEAGMFR